MLNNNLINMHSAVIIYSLMLHRLPAFLFLKEAAYAHQGQTDLIKHVVNLTVIW